MACRSRYGCVSVDTPATASKSKSAVQSATTSAYTANPLGHEDPTFTLRMYTHAVKRRDRLSGSERREFDRAVEWAQWARMGTETVEEAAPSPASATALKRETAD
jgi:hypothetical protein